MPPSVTTKDMLSAIIRYSHTGKVPKLEAEAMENIWDSLHRYGKLSHKQMAYVQTVYLKHKLDKAETLPAAQKMVAKNVGYIEDSKFTAPIRVKTLLEFENLCPHIPKGSPVWQRVVAFLKDSAHVIELRPPKK